MAAKHDRTALVAWQHPGGMHCVRDEEAHACAQDSTTSGANVKKLDAESTATVKNIEKSIAAKKKEVCC